jgi:hypothetical protein
MFNDFDDLFDDFFGKKSNDPLKGMRDLINKLNDFSELNDDTTNPYESELGEPNEVTEFEENGYKFKRSVWETEHGSIVKVEMIHSPLDTGFTPKTKKKISLEDRLAIAIEEERYEDAAKIRDEIKARDKNNL